MKTLQEMCQELGVNINTMRYHLNRNEQDCSDGSYFIRLEKFLEARPILRGRVLRKIYCIEDEYNFKHQYQNYISWFHNLKKIKKQSSIRWNESSIECWKNKGNCSKCSNHIICMKSKDEPPYPMVSIVEKLLKEVGEPDLFTKLNNF